MARAARRDRPLIRNQAAALLSTTAAVVIVLASGISPANAAFHGNGAAIQSAAWPAGLPLLPARAGGGVLHRLVLAGWAAG